MRVLFAPARRCSLTPFFDKNRDKAVYVLISFSRNLTTRCFESCIAHLRADRLALSEKSNTATPNPAPAGPVGRDHTGEKSICAPAAPVPNHPSGNSPTRGCVPSVGKLLSAPESKK